MINPVSQSEKSFVSEKQAISSELENKTMLPIFANRDETWDFYSFLGLLPDPDPVLAKMDEGVEILESLLADGHLTSVIQTRKVGTLAKDYTIEPGAKDDADADARSKKIHAAFTEDMFSLNLRDVTSQLLDAMLYGFVPVEIMWQAKGGMLRIAGLRPLPARWFSFDSKNTPVFLSQKAPITGLPLPPGKFMLARHNATYDNPFGNRLLSRCFWPVYFKRGGLKFWVRFLEKFAGVFMIGKTPNTTQAKPMFDQLKKMVQNAVAVISADASVEILQGNVGGTTDAYERFKSAMDSEISKVIIGQTLTTEVGDRGTQALGTVHEDVLDSYRQSDQAMVKAFYDDLAWLYCQVNDASALPPSFSWNQPEDEKSTLAQRDKTLSDTGQVEFTKEYFMRKYGFIEGDINVIQKQQAQPQPQTQNNQPMPIHGQNFSEVRFPDQEAIDAFIRSIPPGKFRGLSSDVMKPVISMINTGNSYEEIIGKIAEIYPEMKTDELEETMARAIFVSDIYGRLTAEKGQ